MYLLAATRPGTPLPRKSMVEGSGVGVGFDWLNEKLSLILHNGSFYCKKRKGPVKRAHLFGLANRLVLIQKNRISALLKPPSGYEVNHPVSAK